MEIESSKTPQQIGKRRRTQVSFSLEETPIKRVKVSKSNENYHLSNMEKSFIFLNGFMGTEPEKIARDLKRDKRSVKAFLKDADSPNPFAPKHIRKGRWQRGSGILNERHKQYLMRWIDQGTIKSARNAYLRLNSIKSLKRISYHPVRNFLKSKGEFRKPQLKSEISAVNREKRLNYCRTHKSFNFKKVLFTDESTFQLNSNNQKVFQVRGRKTPRRKKFNPNIKIMVWGGISYSGKTSLFIIHKNLNTEGYIKILKEKRREMKNLFENQTWYFQHDGAPCHRPAKVNTYIKKWLTKNTLPHPPQSPDLNPIELIWAQVKGMVERKNAKTRAELLEAVVSSWEKVTRSTIRRCIDGLSKKMKKIIEMNGDLL